MRLQTINAIPTTRTATETFLGYDHNVRILDGEWYDCVNLSSDAYPVLSARKERHLYANPTAASGLIDRDGLLYIDGTDVVYNGTVIAAGFVSNDATMKPKQIVSMGAYAIIFPDKKYINLKDYTDKGAIEASTTVTASAQDPITFEMCTVDGDLYSTPYTGPTEPANPNNDPIYWVDTSSTPHVLKQWSPSSSSWTPIPTTYVKISAPNLGAAFKQYDGVRVDLSGINNTSVKDLDNTMPIYAVGTNYIVVVGILDYAVTVTSGRITISRNMPDMDFVIESENRLWGCRYGLNNNNDIVNELYACKLGDFKNWYCFMGIASDSYMASLGSDGQFTGAITYLGYPMFFKETCVHKVYGNFPANYQVITSQIEGVEKGSSKSLAICNNALYYKSRTGITVFDGSVASAAISGALGETRYENAVAGVIGLKYYVTMKNVDKNATEDYVYDAAKGIWHKESGRNALEYCHCRGKLYFLQATTGKIWEATGATLSNSDTIEDPVEWECVSGEIGAMTAERKYLTSLIISMKLSFMSEIRVFIEYDADLGAPIGARKEMVYEKSSQPLRQISIPIRVKRCDHLRLFITGKGPVNIYSITKVFEIGGDAR